MSKTKHRLHIKNSSGAEDLVPLFTSLDDLKNKKGHEITVYETAKPSTKVENLLKKMRNGNPLTEEERFIINTYETTKNKKLTLYFPIGEVGDPEQTSARIKDKNGNTKAILKHGTPPFTQKFFKVPKENAGVSNYKIEFEIPSGVSRIRYTLCPAGMTTKVVGSLATESNDVDVYAYIQGSDTTITYGKEKISAQTNGATKGDKYAFVWGCKRDISFIRRNSRGEETKDFYSIPHGFFQIKNTETYTGAETRNYFYTGYLDVVPTKKLTIVIGAKTGLQNDPQTCGFVVLNYGIGVEK